MSFRPFRPTRRSRSKYGATDLVSTFTTSIGFRKWDAPPAVKGSNTDPLKRFASGAGTVDQSSGKTYKGTCGAYPHYTFGYVEPASGSTLARRAILVKQGAEDAGKVVLEGAEYDATLELIGKQLALERNASVRCPPASAATSPQAPAGVTTVSADAPPAAADPSDKKFDFTPLLIAGATGALVYHFMVRRSS